MHNEWIISSHGGRTGNSFTIPYNCEIRFYCFANEDLMNITANEIFSAICGNVPLRNGLLKQILWGGTKCPNYQIWFGYFDTINNAGIYLKQSMNTFPTLKNDLYETFQSLNVNITLEDVVLNRSSVFGNHIFHCLFCRS